MLIGHQRIWNFLIQSAAKNRLAHAYLFVGPEQTGKKKLSLEFVKWLLCQEKKDQMACGNCKSCLDIEKNKHPDVFVLSQRQEEKKGVVKTFEIGIDEIKSLQHQLSLFPYSAKYKIAIVDEISALTREAANSFLKTLEEPSSNTLIILITSAWQNILPTIISRCQLIKFLPVAESEIVAGLKKMSQDETALRRAARLAVNRPGRAINLLKDPKYLIDQRMNINDFKKALKQDLAGRWNLARQMSQDTQAARYILAQWILWLRDQMLQNIGFNNFLLGEATEQAIKYPAKSLANLIREIQKTQAILNNPSFNARLALEVLMMKI